MYVSANLMKTYAAKPEEVGRLARIVAEYGADIVCVVDSAGGMLPEDIDAYFAGIRAESSIPIGFHGHNNLGLAIALTRFARSKTEPQLSILQYGEWVAALETRPRRSSFWHSSVGGLK